MGIRRLATRNRTIFVPCVPKNFTIAVLKALRSAGRWNSCNEGKLTHGQSYHIINKIETWISRTACSIELLGKMACKATSWETPKKIGCGVRHHLWFVWSLHPYGISKNVGRGIDQICRGFEAFVHKHQRWCKHPRGYRGQVLQHLPVPQKSPNWCADTLRGSCLHCRKYSDHSGGWAAMIVKILGWYSWRQDDYCSICLPLRTFHLACRTAANGDEFLAKDLTEDPLHRW